MNGQLFVSRGKLGIFGMVFLGGDSKLFIVLIYCLVH